MMPNFMLRNPLSNLLQYAKSSCLLAFVSCLFLKSWATTYYVSSSSGNDSYSAAQAQNPSTPWQSIAKINSYFNSLQPGDVISFKRGDVFYGGIVATRSGNAGNPITFNSYGSGNSPLISGLTTVNSWTSIGNNIYQSTVSAVSTALNLVVINGVPQQIGRYPNNNGSQSDPYLYYESFSGGTSITDNQLTTSTNWTGAEVVIRKCRWIMDRSKITNHSGGTLQYNYTNSYQGLPGFGYFIQNDPRTLDQFGEWYLNTSNKNLQIHFGGNQPSSYTVKVSTIDRLMNLGSYKYFTINDIDFEGGNVAGIYGHYGSDVTIQRCNLSQMGKDGILLDGTPNTLIENVNVNYTLNNGICLNNLDVTNSNVRNCAIRNCAMIPGMGGNGDGSYTGLSVNVGSTATVENNIIENIGYNGMEFQGSNVTIRNNFINNVCNFKDDGGGIYTCGNGNTYTNRQIYNNIVINSVGASFGSSGRTPEAEGIYLDRGSSNVVIHDNSTAYMGRDGLMFNNTQNVNAYNNTVFDARWGVEFVRFASDQQVRNNQFTGNIIYPKTADQSTVYYKNWALNSPSAISIQQDIQSISTFDNNIYGTANSSPFGYYYSLTDGGSVQTTSMSFDQWKSFTSKDANSWNAAAKPASLSDLRFEYNASTSAKTIALGANYVGVDNTNYNGSITLDPYTSKILIRTGASTASSGLTAKATIPAVNCSGGNTTVTVSGSGGVTPYSGTGNFSTNPGKGSLKISFPNGSSTSNSVLYAPIGSITAGKTYILKFTTLGTTGNGKLNLFLRQSASPNNEIASSYNAITFGASRVDHQYTFTPTVSDPNGRFDIEISQNSGTTYIDNIAFFEATSSGNLISSNLFSSGQFETGITGINVWSSNNNQVAEWDTNTKINNTDYFTITDATGAKSSAGVTIAQSLLPLTATATAGSIAIYGGTTTVTVSASGGSGPYKGTGTFTVSAGTYNYVVTDANGCTSSVSVSVSQPQAPSGAVSGSVSTGGSSSSSGGLAVSAIPGSLNCTGNTSTVTVSATGGTAPYSGTGVFTTGNYSSSASADKGSLKLSFPASVSTSSSVLFSSVGTITAGKYYMLKFSTIGTTLNGQMKLFLRQSGGSYTALATPFVNIPFGISKIDHQYIFAPTITDGNGRFDIEVMQNSGTTYIDQISFSECTSTGVITGNNLFTNGQFATDISGINIWSSNNNQVAAWDNTGKFTGTGTGSLKLSFPTSVSTASSVLYAPVGPISAGKYYVLKFSTIGTTDNGQLKLFLRQAGSNNNTLATPFTDIPFGIARIDHQYIFAPTVSDANGRFDIEVVQNSGTTYFDQISFYECSSTGVVTGNNLFSSGQFETDISGINVWSSNNNQVAEWDNSGKFSSSAYFNAGKGSLKLSFPSSVSSANTVIFAPVGALSTGKNYVLRFTTLGTSGNGQLNAFLRQTGSPNNSLANTFTFIPFGSSRVDHQFLFTPTSSDDGRFDIEIMQNSGTTYIDNIAFFEANSAGGLISGNLFSAGQFETDISGVNVWSSNNNQVAVWDGTAKISNTNYFTVTDGTGAKSTVGVVSNQPAIPLSAAATAGTISTVGGSTTVTVTAIGGVAPYSGTGTRTVTAGSYNYVVTDANGCTSTASINVSQPGARVALSSAGSSSLADSLSVASSLNTTSPLSIACYPNPSIADFGLFVNGGTLEKVSITVLSVDGKKVYQTTGPSRNTYRFGGNFLPGLYIIKVMQGNTVLMTKVVKG